MDSDHEPSSMENRVLALARRCSIPDARALAILRNRTKLYDSIRTSHFNRPVLAGEPVVKNPVFTLR